MYMYVLQLVTLIVLYVSLLVLRLLDATSASHTGLQHCLNTGAISLWAALSCHYNQTAELWGCPSVHL